MVGELSIYGRRLPGNCRVGFSHAVSIREVAMNPGIDRYVQKIAREAISDIIASARIQRIERDHHVDFRCDVYVFSPEEFWGIVETAAYEIARRYDVVPREPGTPK